MRKFAVRNAFYEDKVVAYLLYDEKDRSYQIQVPEDVQSVEAPLIIADLIEKGQRQIGKKWSLRWVKQRVIPPERQNIGQILRENHMKYYDEFPLLLMNQGRSCHDECYLVEVTDSN